MSSVLATSAEAPPRPAFNLIGRLSQALAVGRTEGQRYLLLLRFVLVNMMGLALLGVAAIQGWLGMMFAVDDTHVCKLLFVLFTVGLVWAGRRAVMLSQELNALDGGDWHGGTRVASFMRGIRGRGGETRAALATALRLKLAHRLAPVRQMASTLVLIGLIGTIIGFIIALSAVDPAAASDPSLIGPMVATLLRGMSMALFKTLTGSILNVWLMVNYRLLEGGAAHLVTRAIEVGERHADA